MKSSIFRIRSTVHGSCTGSRLSILLLALGLGAGSLTAQVNSGSDGHDGAFNPTQNVTIDMTDHPDRIYQYTSVNIPQGVTVSFTPNAGNKPVVWLVQGDCTVSGNIDLSGQYGFSGGIGGPGGYRGGNLGGGGAIPGDGTGPGGGKLASVNFDLGGNASYATVGATAPQRIGLYYGRVNLKGQAPPGGCYGDLYLVPLYGGSGGGGIDSGKGGGGGGAILIASSGTIQLNGVVFNPVLPTGGKA